MKTLKYIFAFGMMVGSAYFALLGIYEPGIWCGVWALLLLELAKDA